MLKFSGPAFEVDNRLLSLLLVKLGLTNAVMFGPTGDVLQPSEVLHRKALPVERGSFRPVTLVNVDMLNCATAQFVQEPLVKGTYVNRFNCGHLGARSATHRIGSRRLPGT